MTVEVVNSVVEHILVATTTIQNPVVILELDGIVVPGNVVIQQIGTSQRYIFPRFSSGNIFITSVSIVYASPLPAISKSIRVYIAEAGV
jgi:hypothetical protein